VTWSTAETLLAASVVGVRLLHFDGSDAAAVSSARPRMLAVGIRARHVRFRFRRSHFPKVGTEKKTNKKNPGARLKSLR